MKLITLIQVSDADPAEETNIAKLLTVSWNDHGKPASGFKILTI